AYHVETQLPTPTPYRKATLQVKRRVEAALRGEAPPEPPPEEGTPPAPAPAVAALGQRAPDFLAPDFTGRQACRLHRLLGRPVLLLFYNPATPTGEQALRFAQQVSEKYAAGARVVALAVSDDAERVRKQHADLGLSFPILAGKGLHTAYGVDGT